MQGGSAGRSDNTYVFVPSGEQKEVFLPIHELGPGDYRLIKEVFLAKENSDDELSIKLYVEFAIRNPTIPFDLRTVIMEVDQDFVSPIGAQINITNGMEGRIYFDRSFHLQTNHDEIWEALPIISSDAFPDDAQYMSSRQIRSLGVYWAWLYGELPPGEYRIEKYVTHRSDTGADTPYVLHAMFTLDGEPTPGFVYRGAVHMFNPFSGVSIFRAEVVEVLDSGIDGGFLGRLGILVENTTVSSEYENRGSRDFIWDNDSMIVLNSDNEQIKFEEIQQGSIVEVTYTGVVHTTNPGQIFGAFLIRCVG